MAAAQTENAGRGNSLDRFLIRAIIAVFFSMVGVAGGYVLAGRGPVGEQANAKANTDAPEAGSEAEPGSETPPPPKADEVCVIHLLDDKGELRGNLAGVALVDVEGARDLDAELEHQRTTRFTCPEQATVIDLAARTDKGELFHLQGVELDPAQDYLELEAVEVAADASAFLARRSEAGVEAPAPEWLTEAPSEEQPEGEAKPLEGSLYIEIRELIGEARNKFAIRDVVKRGGHEIEACITQHGPDLFRVRHQYQLFINEDGEAQGALLLEGKGVKPELDACVEQVIRGWDFGAGEQGSFLQLKTVWTP